jgi:hypothetical protein
MTILNEMRSNHLNYYFKFKDHLYLLYLFTIYILLELNLINLKVIFHHKMILFFKFQIILSIYLNFVIVQLYLF